MVESDGLVPWDLGGASKIRGRRMEKVYLMLTRLEDVDTMGPFVKRLLTQPIKGLPLRLSQWLS